MSAYNEIYVSLIVQNQGRMFLEMREWLPGVDEKWFIEMFMASHARAMLDIANPKYANSPPVETMLRFIEDEMGGEYKKGESWGGFIPEWCGKIYAIYQWKYNVPSKELIKIFPLSEIERVFPTLHQAGWDSAVDKIYEIVTSPYSHTS